MNAFLVAVMNVGLAAVVYLLLVRRIDRKLEPARVVDNIRTEIDGIIVELNQTTDRNIGLVEDRVNRLNTLLEQADRRLAILKREIESRSSSSERYNDILHRAPRPQHPHPSSKSADSGVAEEGKSGEPSSPTPTAGQKAADGQKPSNGRAARKDQIVELHRKGIAANIIANRTGTTVGEVELIISLSDRKE
jgi:hypothetical protein